MIFKPFYRVLGSGVDGSGLGLPIVLEIAQLHRASVSVEDAEATPETHRARALSYASTHRRRGSEPPGPG